MCLRGLPLLCCLLGLSSACENLGESFSYRGEIKLDSGDYYVTVAYWLDVLPIVFAERRGSGKGEQGDYSGGPCSDANPATACGSGAGELGDDPACSDTDEDTACPDGPGVDGDFAGGPCNDGDSSTACETGAGEREDDPACSDGDRATACPDGPGDNGDFSGGPCSDGDPTTHCGTGEGKQQDDPACSDADTTTTCADGPDWVLRFVPLSDVGVEACSTMAATDFIAVGRDGAFRMAVLDDRTGVEQLDFFDARCKRVGPAFDNATRIDYMEKFHFLVRTSDRRAYVVEPFIGRVVELGRDIKSISVLPSNGEEAVLDLPLGAWVHDDRGLQLRDLRGRPMSKRINDVQRFRTYRGSTLAPEGMMAYADDSGVHVVRYDLTGEPDGDGLFELTELWTAEDACTQSFADIIDYASATCEEPDCTAPNGTELGKGRHAWLAMFQPCDERRLVLRRVDDDVTYVIGQGVLEYKIIGEGTPDGPVVFYSRVNEDGSRTYFHRNGGEEPIDMGVQVELSLLDSDTGVGQRMRLTTQETDERGRLFGFWHPDTGFDELLDNVYGSRDTSMVLHDYNPDTKLGTLSACADGCSAPIAYGVPRNRYRQYKALERIGDGFVVRAYINDPNPDDGTPQRVLTVDDRNGLVVDIDHHVSNFVPIENGPARGLIYTVTDPARRGLWFAPR